MSDKRVPLSVVTIDGPSGSGKGTIAALLAKSLGWHLLDSGALYRLTVLCAIKHGINLANESMMAELASTLDVQFLPSENSIEQSILLEGHLVGLELRAETTGISASKVAALPAVRQALLQRQRNFVKTPGLIADGRDMGSVVFPDASAKFFLTASIEERAKRRFKQLQEKGISGSFVKILDDITARDEQDRSRAIAPLKAADDAVFIDSSSLSISCVLNIVMRAIRQKDLLS